MATFVMTLAVPDRSGAPLVALEYARGLVARGHRLVLAFGPLHAKGATRRGDIVESFQALGAVTVEVPALRRPVGPAAPRAIAHLVRQHGAAAVIGVQQRDRVVALKAARRCGVPGVVTLQNQHVFWGPWPLRAVKERYYRHHVRRGAALALAVSDGVAREAHERFGLSPQRIVVVPNAVGDAQPTDHAAVEQRRREFVDDAGLLLLSVGRIDPQKGFDVLLPAIAAVRGQFPALRVVIAGGTTQGPRAAAAERHARELQAQVQHLGLADTVVFAGFRSDVAELLRAADAYVQPSRWEGFPLTLLEAMQAERPVVATEGAGRPAGFVDGTHGYIVPTGDSTGLAKAITMVLQATPLQRMEMGRANGALVRANYRIDDVRRRSADALEGLVGGPSTRPAEHIAE